LPRRTQLSINFVDTRGVHVQRMRDINAPLPGTYIGPGTGARPFAGLGDIYLYESSGIFKQSQVMANMNSRLTSNIQLQGYYAWGLAHTNANGFPMDQYNVAQDWGRANFDVRQRAFIGGTVSLPFRLSAAPFITMSSGAPFNITTGQQYNGDGIFNARPALATAATPAFNLVLTRWGAFDRSPAYGVPLIPVNYGDGPAQFSVNLRLSRTWGWGEKTGSSNQGRNGVGPAGGFGGFGGGPRGGGFGGPRGSFGGGGRGGFGGGGNSGKRYNLTASISARNAFNHANLGQPVGNLSSTLFGQSTSLANGTIGAGGPGGQAASGPGASNPAAGNRKVELQIRFQF
jgi:hypothetical protein